MTEKRFKQVGVCFIDKFDTKISYCCANEIDCKNIVGKLNELDTKYIDEFNLRETLQQDLQRVEKENEQLKKIRDVAFELAEETTQHNLWKFRTFLKEYNSGE